MELEFSHVGTEALKQQSASSPRQDVPGMSQYEDSSIHTEDFRETDQASAGVSQRCEFFELSPR